MKSTLYKTKKPRQSCTCDDCGRHVPMNWVTPVPTPLGVLELGFGQCTCGSTWHAVEATPPDADPDFLRFVLRVFTEGSLVALRHGTIKTGEAVPLDATKGAHHGKQHH